MSVKKLSEAFCELSEQSLEVLAAKKTKKKKLDPNAGVRNRGTVCVPASSAKDKKDHFPINSESQARNALARVHQCSSVPSWYKGSLKSLQELVSRKVHSKYKGIEISKSKKSKNSELELATAFEKFATIEKDAASKEQVDRVIGHLASLLGTLEVFSRQSSMALSALKAQYSEVFDPELEHRIIETIPKLEEVIVNAAKQVQNVRYRLKELLDATNKNAPMIPAAPNTKDRI